MWSLAKTQVAFVQPSLHEIRALSERRQKGCLEGQPFSRDISDSSCLRCTVHAWYLVERTSQQLILMRRGEVEGDRRGRLMNRDGGASNDRSETVAQLENAKTTTDDSFGSSYLTCIPAQHLGSIIPGYPRLAHQPWTTHRNFRHSHLRRPGLP